MAKEMKVEKKKRGRKNWRVKKKEHEKNRKRGSEAEERERVT